MLALVLACSLAVGVTGAWFTDGVGLADPVTSGNYGFGKVDIALDGAVTISQTVASGDISKMVDGDKITIADTVAFTNSSTVDIYYVLDVDYTITISSGAQFDAADLTSWLGLTAAPQDATGYKAAGAAITHTALGGDKVLNSAGAANGKTGTFSITINVKLAAIQAGNVASEANANEAFKIALSDNTYALPSGAWTTMKGDYDSAHA